MSETNGRARTGAGDPEVVSTAALAAVLRQLLFELETERPVTGDGVGAWGDRRFMGSLVWITEITEVEERIVQRILRLETKTTSLRLADQLLSKLGLTYKMHNGEVPIIPNPGWSSEYWAEYMQERGCET